MPYVQREQDWGAAPRTPKADRLDINASNISTLTIAPARAHVDCRAALNVVTDGPLSVVLAGCHRVARFAAAAIRLSVHPRRARVGARVAFTFRATLNGRPVRG